MTYRIQLDMTTQQFIAIDTQNQHHTGTGRTIEQAVAKLKA
ncbi:MULTISPECIES: hypothetical protein [Lacticaseibacillus]|jgi:hypothetical protein|nr:MULTISPECIES: hypothetical protein [Lacticaseibacillus]